jgi:hypothetical protein
LPEPKASDSGATAFRSIGIGVFANGDSAVALCEHIANDLRAKSSLNAMCLKQMVSEGASPKSLADLGRRSGVDAILTGTVSGGSVVNSVAMNLISARSGKVIATFKSESTKADPAGGAIVDAIVAAIPYRGYVVRLDGDEIDINLGSLHGIQPGMMLSLFEISGASLGGSRSAVATIEVTEVTGPDVSTARILERRAPIREYTKIAHENVEEPKQAAIARTASGRTLFSFGFELLTIDTEINGLQNLNRTYRMNSTPFVQLGIARDRWFARFWYGYASDTEETLSYSAALAAYRLKAIGDFKSGYTISLGAWVSQYSERARRTLRYSPHLEIRYQYVPSNSFALFASAEANYPLFTSKQDSGQVPFSYSFGSTPGFRYNITDWISLEAGTRFQYFTIPLAGKSGTYETHVGYFARGVFLL